MNSLSRKKFKKRSKIKKYLLLILILIIGVVWAEEKRYKAKIEMIFSSIKEKEKIEKTNLKNLFIICKKDGLSLLFINKYTDNIEINGLSGIGNVKYNAPIRVMKNKKFGFYDRKGKLIIPIEYEKASDFIDGIAVVKKGSYGVIDEFGKEILPNKYDNIFLGINRKVILEKDGKYYLSDLKKGEEIEVNYIYQLDDKKVIFEKNGFLGVMDFLGKILIPNEYEEMSRYIDKTFIGKKNGKYSVYSLENNKKLTKNYDYIEQLNKNVYIAGTNEKGKYAFLSANFSTEEIYENILKLDGTFLKEICVYAGLKEDSVDILEEDKGIITQISKEEFKSKMIK